MTTTETATFPVMFTSGGDTIAGRVHRRAESITERQPAVLVTGSWLTVKEQMADRYAAELAQRGYTAITFDFAGWGESGGGMRHAELPSRKIADVRAAAEFVSTLSFVRPGQVGYLGVCASAQYALTAAAEGAPISSYASVAGWFHDTGSVAPFYGGAEGVQLRIDRAREAFERYQRDGELVTVPAYEVGNDRAGMFFELDYYGDPARGAVPTWANEMAEVSWIPWLTFDGVARASAASVPALFVHSDGCVFPENIERLRRGLRGPVEVVWGDGEQTDFYDRPAQVSFAVDALDAHFAKTLAGSTTGVSA
ncbi:alpha/beta hydrolase [Phytoactinopolyspora halotolerans]|uniref:Alpha/beta hydrolase n=1 Tax=Phytoactinopolyspora halotolerans TaxID=1981512 RepID=A0A6L9S4K1_9ACTN|nr:CocE/NonD family hydrolase [Phytoactinopolyspora halotolerans]NEE00076.1 alpha/beta hydrolase [Phytoactinopolyspora halotolerans]